ncbi:hypothetical protein ONR57_03165 [Hoyosella sp. YIM 151337]|uniref:DUF6912 family protein n=1 Tax=Hoyosella sp. YIM 151337 TaxID=2992742 RepID=UPI00223605B2|nr:hypothetical protein [Hoyosella sp. YIM 151337]MCW4352295.1 hypothetical protein [Hoyosella sp. YIM 151337]
MRIYIPVTVRMLHQLVAEGELFPVAGRAFAVTPALREAFRSGDDEELAEIAMRDAARASLRLLAAEAEAEAEAAPVTFRRAVLAADFDGEVRLRPDLDDAVVSVGSAVTMKNVASAHIDLAEAEKAVAQAVDVIDQADLGDTEAEFLLGEAEDHELAWYAAQELRFLVELL